MFDIVYLFCINKLSISVYLIDMIDFKYLFNAAELLAASGPSPWPTHCMFSLQSVGQVKQFIEQLSQYIAPGRLALKAPHDTHLTGVLSS